MKLILTERPVAVPGIIGRALGSSLLVIVGAITFVPYLAMIIGYVYWPHGLFTLKPLPTTRPVVLYP